MNWNRAVGYHWTEISAIRGYLISGASPEEIYRMFDFKYPLSMIWELEEELKKGNKLKNS